MPEISVTTFVDLVLRDGYQGRTLSILDVRGENPFRPNKEISGMLTLLEGESSVFQTMWSQV